MSNEAINLLKEVLNQYRSNNYYRQEGVAVSEDRILHFSAKKIGKEHFILNLSAELPDKSLRHHVAKFENEIAQVSTRDGWKELPSIREAMKVLGGASAGVSSFLERLLFAPIDSIEWSSFEPFSFELSENPTVAIIKGTSRLEQETLYVDIKNLNILWRESYIQTNPTLLLSCLPELEQNSLDWPEISSIKPLKTVIELTDRSFDRLVFPDDFQPIITRAYLDP